VTIVTGIGGGPYQRIRARVPSEVARRIVGHAMAILYRCTTPTDHLCVCGKVARALRAEGIDFEVERVPLVRSKRPEVQALTGQTRVPVLVLGGETICDSRRILEHLEYRREQT
jgi:glutaredoxin